MRLAGVEEVDHGLAVELVLGVVGQCHAIAGAWQINVQYQLYRKAVIDFLYTRQSHVESRAA